MEFNLKQPEPAQRFKWKWVSVTKKVIFLNFWKTLFETNSSWLW